MTFGNIASGFSCLFEVLVIVGYLAGAWLLHSWIMVLLPFAFAGAVLVWAIIRSRFDE